MSHEWDAFNNKELSDTIPEEDLEFICTYIDIERQTTLFDVISQEEKDQLEKVDEVFVENLFQAVEQNRKYFEEDHKPLKGRVDELNRSLSLLVTQYIYDPQKHHYKKI